jgi:nitroreductase / dihydropteridine reductase
MSLIHDLEWRYAAKKLNGQTITEDKMNAILEATRLSASSYGLQSYKIVVVSNQETKDKLQAAAYNQVQIGTSDSVLVFCVQEKLTADDVNKFVDNIVETRKIDPAMLDGYKQMMLNTVTTLTDEQQQEWSGKQAYIALGTALAAAAEQQVDSCPMEGFDKAQFDEILGLKDKGLKSVVIMPLGYRASDDHLASMAKVRKSTEELYHFVK